MHLLSLPCETLCRDTLKFANLKAERRQPTLVFQMAQISQCNIVCGDNPSNFCIVYKIGRNGEDSSSSARAFMCSSETGEEAHWNKREKILIKVYEVEYSVTNLVEGFQPAIYAGIATCYEIMSFSSLKPLSYVLTTYGLIDLL